MKKIFLLIAIASLSLGVTSAQDSTKVKEKKTMTHAGKTCQKPVKTRKL